MLVTVTGWTIPHIDANVCMSDYNRLMRYWHNYPPVHIMVGAYLGAIKTKPSLTWENESAESLIARFGAAQSG